MKRIIIGIPTYNEGETISKLVKSIDNGLMKLSRSFDGKIVLVDSNSRDNTVNNFINTNCKNNKKLFVLKNPDRGKGRNLLKLFDYARKQSADYVLTFDGDLQSFKPEWISQYILHLQKGFDIITPNYGRNKFEGSTTNHLAFPVIYAVFGKFIRQPIAGDFGFSKKLYNYILDQDYNQSTLKYGIDIFLTINAIYGGFKIKSINLDSKIHKASFDNMTIMFPQIIKTFKHQLAKQNYVLSIHNDKLTNRSQNYNKLSSFKHKNKAKKLKSSSLKDLKNINSIAFQNDIKLAINNQYVNSNNWIPILNKFIFYKNLTENDFQAISMLFYIRITNFWQQIEFMNNIDVEDIILEQAKQLRLLYINNYPKNELLSIDLKPSMT